MNREERTAEIGRLKDKFSSSAIAVCFNYHGLTVSQITALRKVLRESGSEGKVIKNTLAKISAKDALKDAPETEREQFMKLLDGPSFIVFSPEDPIAPTKVITKFQEQNQKLEIKGAWFEGKFLNSAGVKELSALPSREETLAKLLALMQAPATQLVRLLQAPSANLVRLVEAYRQKLEKGS